MIYFLDMVRGSKKLIIFVVVNGHEGMSHIEPYLLESESETLLNLVI